MGPTPFSVGYAEVVVLRELLQPRFNGANAFQRWTPAQDSIAHYTNYTLQWGQRLSALDTDVEFPGETRDFGPTTRFNGANAFQRWIPSRQSRLFEAPESRFNGANAFQRWIQHFRRAFRLL